MVDCLICGDDHPSMAPHRPGAIQKLRAEVESERTALREAEAEADKFYGQWKAMLEVVNRKEAALRRAMERAVATEDRADECGTKVRSLIAAVEEHERAPHYEIEESRKRLLARVRSISQGDSE